MGKELKILLMEMSLRVTMKMGLRKDRIALTLGITILNTNIIWDNSRMTTLEAMAKLSNMMEP